MDKTKRKEHKRITTNKTKARTLSLSWLNKPVTPHADFEESWERLDCKQHQKRLDTVSRSHGGGGGGQQDGLVLRKMERCGASCSRQVRSDGQNSSTQGKKLSRWANTGSGGGGGGLCGPDGPTAKSTARLLGFNMRHRTG